MARLLLVISSLLLVICACQPPPEKPPIRFTPHSVPFMYEGGPVSSSAVAVSPDGKLVVAVNPDSDSITLVDVTTLTVLAEIPVGDDPRTLSFTPDSKTVVVANHGSATLSKVNITHAIKVTEYDVGSMPYGVVTDGIRAFVSEFGLGTVSVLDLTTGEVTSRLPVDAFPTGLALSGDGQRLLVTHFFTGHLTVINPHTAAVLGTISTGSDTNLSQAVITGADASLAYIPQTRFNVDNTARLFDTTVFPVVNVLDIGNLKLLPRKRITLDTADEPVNMPFSIALSPDEKTIYVANAGSDDVSVIDLNTNRGLAHISVSSNPRGIAITPDGAHVYVNNVLDGNLSVINTDTFMVTNLIAITKIPLSSILLEGKKIFNSAASPSLTTDHWISCATCHFDGMMDGRTWLGFPDGPRNTPALFGVHRTLPMHWSGDFDELQDVEVTIRDIQFGTGLISDSPYDTLGESHAGVSQELDALAAYLGTIKTPQSPLRGNRAEINIGKSVFENLGCESCHMPPLYTDRKLHDVGTGDPTLERNSHGRGTRFDTPSLIGLWLTAPYFHDGSASTLKRLLTMGTVHNILGNVDAEELASLVTFLNSLPNDSE